MGNERLEDQLKSNITKSVSGNRIDQSFADGWNKGIEAAIDIVRTRDVDVVSMGEFARHVVKTYQNESYDRLVAGLAEEVGEIIQVTKKFRNSDPSAEDRSELALEIGDLIRYACLLAYKARVPLEKILYKNMQKMEARWPHCFGIGLATGGTHDGTAD